MNKKISTTICFLMSAVVLHAQQGWLPSLRFGSDTSLCDTSSWKLVFSENFDGNTIDRNKWITFVSWAGMPGGDNEHWNAARSDKHMNYIYRDANVVVSDGTCKLLIRRETGNWSCDSCDDPVPYRRHTSAGALSTYYNLPDGSPSSYNTGKFEARIKFPVFNGAWCAFWTWHGNGVNEIDIAEAWGGGRIGSDQRRNKYGTHAWGPNPNVLPPEPNPLGLPYDAAMGGIKFPGQGWWSHLLGSKYHAQEDWHVYTCEWDHNLIRFYIDGGLVNTYWKYIKSEGHVYNGRNYRFLVGSGCKPEPDTAYYVQYGFPYHTNSLSQLRLSTGVDHRVATLNNADIRAGKDSVLQPNTLGQMEIDYVKIWQRHPAQDHHAEVPDIGLMKSAKGDTDELFCHDLNEDSTSYSICVVKAGYGHGQQFQFFEGSYFPQYENSRRPPVFEWDIDIVRGRETRHYNLYGQFVATPFFKGRENESYSISWKVKITDAKQRVVERRGLWYPNMPLYPQRGTRIAYFDAFLTDSAAYEQAVGNRAGQLTFSEAEARDPVYINNKIEQIRVEELEPYLNLIPEVPFPVAQKQF